MLSKMHYPPDTTSALQKHWASILWHIWIKSQLIEHDKYNNRESTNVYGRGDVGREND